MRRLVACAVIALSYRLVGGCEPGSDTAAERRLLEAALREWNVSESADPYLADANAIRCREDFRPSAFRGRVGFRCDFLFADGSVAEACYALVARDVYQVGGCIDPLRDLGVGKGRLVYRPSP